MLAAARAVAAMRLGRVDEETTANVGRIDGGGASTNVVPEQCRLEAEARSLDAGKVEALVAEMVDRVHDAANATECDVDVSTQRLFDGYRTRPSAPAVSAAERGAARLRLRAAAHRHRRRLGCQRAAGRGLSVREPGQRHRAQPRARPSASAWPRSRGCSTSRSSCSRSQRNAEAAPWHRRRGRRGKCARSAPAGGRCRRAPCRARGRRHGWRQRTRRRGGRERRGARPRARLGRLRHRARQPHARAGGRGRRRART